jgi:uncharacterized protein (DUF488 family)
MITFSMGHSNRSFEEFLKILKNYNIKNLIDVRRFPSSRKFPHFNKNYIEEKMKENGINYVWLGEFLGGKIGSYIEHMKRGEFKEGIKKIEEICKNGNTLFFCAEKFYWKCHRKFISRELIKRGYKIIDIIENGKEIRIK